MNDYALGTTVYIHFTTRRFSTGVPYALAGTPAISVLEEGNATPITAGITLTTSQATVTGLNEIAIVASGANGYEVGKEYAAYISAGTVDSVSVVGEVVGRFSIEKQSALRPTTAGRTLDVSAGGEAGLDWANVGSPTTVVGLSGTTIKTATDVETDTADIQTRIPAALVAGRIDASAGAMALNVLTSTALDATAVAEIQAGLSTLDAAGIRTAVGLASANLDTQLDALPTAIENADTLLDRNMATGTDSGSSTVRTVRQALRFLRNKWSLSGTALTVTKEDDATASWTATVTTDAAANPITGNDPA